MFIEVKNYEGHLIVCKGNDYSVEIIFDGKWMVYKLSEEDEIDVFKENYSSNSKWSPYNTEKAKIKARTKLYVFINSSYFSCIPYDLEKIEF